MKAGDIIKVKAQHVDKVSGQILMIIKVTESNLKWRRRVHLISGNCVVQKESIERLKVWTEVILHG